MAKKKDSAEKPPKEKGKKSWMILGTGLSVLAGIATTKALDATWKAATGREPPNAPGSPEIGNSEALVWAGVTGLGMGVARMYATRKAANYWVKSFGVLPPGMSEGATKETRQKLT